MLGFKDASRLCPWQVLMAACRPGDFVVLGRNCHQSALGACVLAGVTPFFADVVTDPLFGIAHGVTAAAADAALAQAARAAAQVGASRVVLFQLFVPPESWRVRLVGEFTPCAGGGWSTGRAAAGGVALVLWSSLRRGGLCRHCRRPRRAFRSG